MHFPAASVVGPGPWVWGEECCTHIHPHLNFLDVRQLSTDGALVTNTPTHALTITYTSSLHRIYSYGRWSCNARQTPKKKKVATTPPTPTPSLPLRAWVCVPDCSFVIEAKVATFVSLALTDASALPLGNGNSSAQKVFSVCNFWVFPPILYSSFLLPAFVLPSASSSPSYTAPTTCVWVCCLLLACVCVRVLDGSVFLAI